MGAANFQTTIAHWYGHQAKRMNEALTQFKSELERHCAEVRDLDARVRKSTTRVALPEKERVALENRWEEIGPTPLDYCFVEPRQLINDYTIALWLPSGSNCGWGSDKEHQRLAELFRTLACDSGAHVLVAWDFDLGEGHGVEVYGPTGDDD